MFRSSGLVFEWKAPIGVEPPATNLRDRSRFGSNGTFRADGQPDWVQTPKGIWVLDFNSANPDYIEIPADQTQLDFTFEDFSIIMQIKPALVGSAYHDLFCRGREEVDGYRLRIHDNGRLFFHTWQAAAFQFSASSVGDFASEEWTTAGITRSGDSVTMYKNGDALTLADIGVHIHPATCARTVKIGIYESLIHNPFDGKIAYLAIWNYALSQGQHKKKHFKLSQFGV